MPKEAKKKRKQSLSGHPPAQSCPGLPPPQPALAGPVFRIVTKLVYCYVFDPFFRAFSRNGQLLHDSGKYALTVF